MLSDYTALAGRFPKTCTAEEAVTAIQSNHSVFVHGGSATPTHLIKALSKYGLGDGKLRNVTLIHIHTVGELPVGPEYAGVFWVSFESIFTILRRTYSYRPLMRGKFRFVLIGYGRFPRTMSFLSLSRLQSVSQT